MREGKEDAAGDTVIPGTATRPAVSRAVSDQERAVLPRTDLRASIIAGLVDCPLTPGEAATLMGVSETWLRRSDVPRANVGGTKYLKSQCLAYVRARLTHRVLEEKAS